MKNRLLYWTPRVIAIMAILFMMIFSLDCFEGSYTIGERLTCFVMHNIPSFLVVLILIAAWKWELAGGILFLLAALTGSILFRGFSGNPASLIVMAPFAVAGILFIIHNRFSAGKQD
ncbi:MAG: hypothetical protein FD166_2378 [Bacteroidetes bacterium]|nr:MAG: hypothetical protein FD166_2378 [Bacteroidota bacterium]